MVIQELKPSKRVQGRWLAVLEDGSILRLGEGEVVDFALFAGKELTDGEAEELTAAARELLQTGVQKVIVSMGSRGMLHVLPEQTIFVPGLRVPVKDTVGAGDAVSAALAVAEERGLTLEETLRLSTAAGAASVMCTGTQAASLETIQQLMEQVTYREL